MCSKLRALSLHDRCALKTLSEFYASLLSWCWFFMKQEQLKFQGSRSECLEFKAVAVILFFFHSVVHKCSFLLQKIY